MIEEMEARQRNDRKELITLPRGKRTKAAGGYIP